MPGRQAFIVRDRKGARRGNIFERGRKGSDFWEILGERVGVTIFYKEMRKS
jgi:hypothetical protein